MKLKILATATVLAVVCAFVTHRYWYDANPVAVEVNPLQPNAELEKIAEMYVTLDFLRKAYTSVTQGDLTVLQQAANEGNPLGMFLLAVVYEKKKELEQAKVWYLKAGMSGKFPAGYYNYALLLEKAGDKESALKYYLLAADQRLPVAALRLGVGYEKGDLMDADPVQARDWYARGARLGEYTAQLNYGVFLAKGLGGERDLVAGWAWLKMASGKNAQARSYLGLIEKNMSQQHLAEAADLYQTEKNKLPLDLGDMAANLPLGLSLSGPQSGAL